jgi:hypothetical protein
VNTGSARARAVWRSRAGAWWAPLALWLALAAAPAQAQAAPAGRAAPARAAAATWDGAQRVLQVNENAALPQTPAGSVVFSYLNLSTQNNFGELALTSGGGSPVFLEVQPLATQPGFVVTNWRANNLSVTNVSANNATPIRIQAIGPGMPGTTPVALATGGPGLQLAPGAAAQGPTQPRPMQMVVQATSGARTVVAAIGGPADSTGSNAYVIAVNAGSTTGPLGSANPPPPPGYYATTVGNTFVLDFNWAGSILFVANLSSTAAPAVTLVLRPL